MFIKLCFYCSVVRYSYETEEWEQVTVLKTVMLKSEGTMSGVKGYIAMGTNFSLGEENVSRGKVKARSWSQ